MNEYTAETDKQVLMDALRVGERGTLNRDGIMMRLLELNLVPLIAAIESASTASDNLGRKVLWLNIILGSATVAGFVAAVIGLIKCA